MEKIKKSMRREDGFTLVELLAVIVILGVILAIAIPAIGNVITKSRTDAQAAEYDLIIDAGRIYLTSNDGTYVEVSTLISEGYIEQRSGEDIHNDYKAAYVVRIKTDATPAEGENPAVPGKYEYVLASDNAGATTIGRP